MADELRASLTSYRDIFGAYHNHKEQMAYLATTLYLSAATWAAFEGPSSLGSGSARIAMALLLSFSPLAASTFVIWQLWKRRLAADIVEACNSLLATKLDDQLTEARPYGGVQLPSRLVEAIIAKNDERPSWHGPRPSEAITVTVILVWTAFALIRVIWG